MFGLTFLQLWRWFAISWLVVGILLLFVLLLGPQSRYVKPFYHIWLQIVSAFNRIVWERLSPMQRQHYTKCSHYWLHERNPLFQIILLVLFISCCLIYLVFGYVYLEKESIHKWTVPLTILCTLVSYYLVCTRNPGFIHKNNLKKVLAQFPYDGVLFEPYRTCKTCHFEKPARSKHCSLCGFCIARQDHHCAWINQCVGQGNHAHFLLFLFLLTWTCLYGFYLTLLHMDRYLKQHQFHLLGTMVDGQWTKLTSFQLFQAYLHAQIWMATLSLFTLLLFFVLFLFTAYQFYLAARGVTTNERSKWDDILAYFAHEKCEGLHVPLPLLHGKGVWSDQIELPGPLEFYAARRANEKGKKVASMVLVENVNQLRFIYDRGIWYNFKQLLQEN